MSRLSLDSVEWKEFFIGGEEGLFNISSTKSGIDKNKLLEYEGCIPYITRSNINNGIDMFVGKTQDQRFKINNGNVITIGLDTQTVFYQPKKFYTGQNIQVLENGSLNKETALFLVPLLKTQMEKFSWGSTGATLTRLNRTKILLPIDDSGNPNWKFMEDFINQKQKVQAQKIIDYYGQRILECGFELLGLEDVEWEEYNLTEFFDIKRGNQNNMSECLDGDIPLVSAKKVDNGYKAFISDNRKEMFAENILTLNNDGDGGVGIAYFQPHHMALDTHVTALIPKILIDKYSLLFLARIITNQRDKFSHGYSINNSRLQKQKFMLPIDENRKPHWDYMSQFMKKIEAENLSKVLEYIYIYIYKLAISMESMKYSLSKIEWKEFWIEDIADIKSGVRLTKSNEIPFIGSTGNNNGVTSFVSNINNSLDKNILGVNYNGSVVENFYHPYKCIFSDDVKRLHFKEKVARNKYCYLFLKASISKQKVKYAYGYKFNAERMKRQKILLPIDNRGEIDYDFMKRFMVIQEIKECYKIIDYYTKAEKI